MTGPGFSWVHPRGSVALSAELKNDIVTVSIPDARAMVAEEVQYVQIVLYCM